MAIFHTKPTNVSNHQLSQNKLEQLSWKKILEFWINISKKFQRIMVYCESIDIIGISLLFLSFLIGLANFFAIFRELRDQRTFFEFKDLWMKSASLQKAIFWHFCAWGVILWQITFHRFYTLSSYSKHVLVCLGLKTRS